MALGVSLEMLYLKLYNTYHAQTRFSRW